MAHRLGWVVGALFLLAMAVGADYPPPLGFALVAMVAVVLGVAVDRLVPPFLRQWDDAGAVRALGRAALVGFAAGALLCAPASIFHLVTGANSGGVGVQVLGFPSPAGS